MSEKKEKSCNCNSDNSNKKESINRKTCEKSENSRPHHEHGEKCHCGSEKKAHHDTHGHEHKHETCGHDHSHGGEHEGCGCGCDHEHGNAIDLRRIIAYVIGGVLLILAFWGELFLDSFWVSVPCAALVYVYFGKDVWMDAIRGIQKKKVFTEFTLMCVATVGAMALLEFADAAAVMYLYSLGEVIQGVAYRKSRKNIAELIEITEDYINKVENGKVRRVAASEARPGDVINVTVGERIPLDGVVVSGDGFADTSAVTGESIPKELVAGVSCLSGSVLAAGAVSLRVTEVYENSTASKLRKAVERATLRKARTEKRIGKFAAIFTPCAFLVSLLLFAVLWIATKDIPRALKSALVVLVASCPCSLVLSVPLAYFSGIGKAAERGIVFRGGEVIDNAAVIGTILLDKTGTLTSSTLDFDGVWLPDRAPLDKAQLLDVCGNALLKSPHAAAHSFCEAYRPKRSYRIDKVRNIGGRGLLCEVEGNRAAFGNRAMMEELGVSVKRLRGSVIYVVMEGELCGALLFRSKLKPETLPEIAKLRGNQVERIAIVSGDTVDAVKDVAEDLGISEYYAELKPDEKMETLDNIYKEEKKRNGRKTVAFCGDGLNDSAAIVRADVGIAMGSGSAITVESADVVIVDDSIARVNDMMAVAKSTMRIVTQNIALSLGIKMAAVFVGLFVTELSLELAIVADVGAAVLAVFNAMRAGRLK